MLNQTDPEKLDLRHYEVCFPQSVNFTQFFATLKCKKGHDVKQTTSAQGKKSTPKTPLAAVPKQK